MKFLADSSLGRLSKWLRLLGYDTVYWRGEADRSFLRKAEKEGRVVLTRRRDVLARQHPGSRPVRGKRPGGGSDRRSPGKAGSQPEPEKLLHLVPSMQRIPEGSHTGRGAASRSRLCVPDSKRVPGVPGLRQEYIWPGTHRDRAMKTIARLLETKPGDKPQAASHKPQGQ